MSVSDQQNTDQQSDQRYMARAIQLAKKGLYTTHPNPRVGCVLVKNNQVIAEDYHQFAGQAHAEVNAIQIASEAVKNSTAYITLEPCSHTGKTPPCADALIKAGVSRVVVAMLDPNPQVSGRGIKKLIEANIDVNVGVLEEQARTLNAGFIKRMEKGMPFVRIKMAMSLDGKTAMASGESQWITAEQARHNVQELRAQSAAILTGSGTVEDDDPSLNVRLSSEELGFEGDVKQPLRVVLDTNLKISSKAKMLGLDGDTLIYTCSGDTNKIQTLTNAGAEVKVMMASEIVLSEVLADLAERQINEVHVEAGATLCGALLAEQLVDELIVYIAPSILGGDARSLFNMPQLQKIKDKVNLNITDIRAVGDDWKITAILNYSK